MINDNIFEFIKEKVAKLSEMGIDVYNLELDHFGYQCSTKEKYEIEKEQSRNIGELKHEAIVNERRVAIFELKCPIQFGTYLLSGFELIEPKPNQVCEDRIDHIEFILKESFEDFMKKHPNVNWDTKAIDRKPFARLNIPFEDGTSVKFHKDNILKEY